MQKAPVLKGSGLAPIDDEPVHVFGRNLESRVVETREDEDKREDENKQEEDDVETIKKRKFDAITGEENEETVFQGEFKLFVWDFSSSNWIERGRGQLKLNDDLEGRRSRLIMRAGGTFRIILNVAIRHSLFKVISNTKTSIRFSDSQNVWAASGSNAKQLGDLLNDRIAEAANVAQEEEDNRTKEQDQQSESTNRENAKHDEEQGQDEKADAHSSSGDHPKKEDETAKRTIQPTAEESVGSDGGGNDEKDQEYRKAQSEEHQKKVDHTDEQDDSKKVAAPDTTDEDDEDHHKGNDESKRLKLSSD